MDIGRVGNGKKMFDRFVTLTNGQFLTEMLKVIVRVMLIFFKNDFINLWIAFSSFETSKGNAKHWRKPVTILNPTGNFLNSSQVLKIFSRNSIKYLRHRKRFNINPENGLIYSICWWAMELLIEGTDRDIEIKFKIYGCLSLMWSVFSLQLAD